MAESLPLLKNRGYLLTCDTDESTLQLAEKYFQLHPHLAPKVNIYYYIYI